MKSGFRVGAIDRARKLRFDDTQLEEREEKRSNLGERTENKERRRQLRLFFYHSDNRMFQKHSPPLKNLKIDHEAKRPLHLIRPSR